MRARRSAPTRPTSRNTSTRSRWFNLPGILSHAPRADDPHGMFRRGFFVKDPMQAQRSKDTLYLPALTEYRANCIRRRAEAFCDAPEYVLGTEVLPLTPATFSMLVATGSAFIMGGQPAE